ncbi:Ig-like domain-containing protein [Dyadobacter aurulentus]|uniref:Ig-like domain-containing protein n=1 Tax=Dyadobacter sp. UC 10 TaxID=2605428 RepID=UPI001788D56F|nr:T9SS type A sorting domain-containing protein [Dyadobacter sp. UC 10]
MILYLGLAPMLFAQESIGLEWIKGFQGANVQSHSITRDAQGNFLIAGSFNGATDFDPGPGTYTLTNDGREEPFVVKLDPSGNFIRVMAMKGQSIGSGRAYGIALDAAGNIYLTGYFLGAVDFDPGPGTHIVSSQAIGNSAIFVQKLNADGNLLWVKAMDSGQTSEGNKVQVDAAGNVYSTGYFRGSADFDPGTGTHIMQSNSTISGAGNTYIQKLDTEGNFVWAKSFGATGTENRSEANAIALDGSGNVYTTGIFSGTIDFDPGTGTQELSQEGGATNTFIQKMNADGNFLWAKSIKGSTSAGEGIKTDAGQNVLIAGSFSGTADFDPGTGTSNLSDGPGFVQKLSADGNFVWAKTLTGTGRGVDTDAGSVYVANGNAVQKLNADGTIAWQKGLNGSAVARAVQVDGDGNVYFTGSNTGTITGEGACNYTLNAGGFLAKLNEEEFPEGFAISANTLSPREQTTCVLGIPDVIVGSDVQITAPAGDSRALTYQWQVGTSATGPWTDIAGEIFKDLQPLSGNETRWYRRQVKAVSAFCELVNLNNSAVATVTVNAQVAPIANADGPLWYVCEDGDNTVTLNGSATNGDGNYTYTWYLGSPVYGTEVGSAAAFTTPAITSTTTYTLQVKDGNGCTDIEQVTIAPAIAQAGPDKSFCQADQGVQIGTPPIADPNITYTWEVLSGTTGSLSCTNCAQPIAEPTEDTEYQLTVTVKQKDNTECSSTNTVWVRTLSAPNNLLEFAGTDKTICQGETVVLGGDSAGTGYTYTWSTGQYLSSASTYNPRFDAGTAHAICPVIYTVTATKDGCSFTDEVKVSVIESDIDFADDTRCGPRWVRSREAVNYNCDEATYAWSRVSGTGSIQETRNNGREAYLVSTEGNSIFRRTVTLNGVSCSADIEIIPCVDGEICEFELITVSDQGCPKVFGNFAEIKVGTKYIDPSAYNFKWGPSNMVDNDTAKIVTITNNSPFTLTLTLTNKTNPAIQCNQTLEVNTPSWTLPDFNMAGGAGCAGTPITIGAADAGGFSYQWTGDQINALSDPSISNPVVTVNEATVYTVVVTEDASGCTSTYTVPVDVSTIVVNAGPDRAVCNGGTATLGLPAPAGTNWIYHWEPEDAAWTNGTDGSQAQPQVIFAVAAPQTFTVTATDTLTGCTATDSVVVRNEQEEDEYSGADQEICQGQSTTLGTEAIPGATYAWFEADGTTPATGLSCTTCARPSYSNALETKTFVVKVSFGETCTTPLSANVTITVTPRPASIDLADVNLCEEESVQIGYGNGTNPAAPENAMFQWSPATGLSDPNVANPTATVTQEIIYTVTVDMIGPAGCSFREQVRISPLANAGPDQVICAGETVVLGATAVTGVTYAWTGAGIVGPNNVANPTVRPASTTTYTMTATNADGCESTREVTVTVNTPVDFNITGNTTICEGGVATVGIQGTVPPNTLWEWSPRTGVQDPTNPNTQIAATSTQTYRLTQTNSVSGCTNAKEVVIVVNPGIDVTSANLKLCPDQSKAITLNVTSGSGNYQYRWTPSEFLSDANIANPTVTPSVDRTYSVTVTDLASGCQFVRTVEVDVLTEEECVELPVTLISFDVKKEGTTAQMTWKTASEVNSSHFDIERSGNGREWAAIGRVSAAGDDVQTNSYTFTDTEPVEGINYYRLKMVDRDSTFAYSAIRSGSFERTTETTVFPNPVSDILHIRTSDWKNVSRIDILNAGGLTVYQSQEIPYEEVNITKLPQGTYLVKVTRKNGSVAVRKIVIAR